MKKGKKIGLICSPGGHLVEILYLIEAFEGKSYFFLTYKEGTVPSQENPIRNSNEALSPTEAQRSVNPNGAKIYHMTNFARRPLSLIKGILKILIIFLKERPNILFSSGAEIAIPSFYIGKFFFRTKLIYLECSAQVYHPSLTGKCVYPITDLFLVQWEPLLMRYGPRAKYVGGLI